MDERVGGWVNGWVDEYGARGEESACHAGDTRDVGSIPGWGRPPGEENGYPLQYSCLENPIDRGS